MKLRILTSHVAASPGKRHRLNSIASACVITLTPGLQSSAATWASSQTGNWDNVTVTGWNEAYPNAVGTVASYSNTASTSSAQITQNVGAGVTVGTISLSGTGLIPTATRSLTLVPTNAIVLDQDGAGAGFASIVHATTTGANANDRLVFNAGTLTLADNLLIDKASTVSIVANAIQISSIIGGTGNVTLQSSSNVTGNGNILLSPSAANTFTGSVLVRKGAITFNHAGAFGNAANTITLGESGAGDATLITTAAVGSVPQPIVVASGAGTLSLGSNSVATTATTTFTNTIVLNGMLTLTSVSPGIQPVTFSNVISGIGGLAKTGTGAATINGANTYSGGTTINAGTLFVGNTGTLGQNIVGNDINISGGNLVISNSANLGSSQVINYSSGGIGVNFTPAAPISINDLSLIGGVFGINYTGTGGVTSLASLYSGNWSLGSFTGGTFDGASLAAGIGNLYRLGGGGGTLTILNNVLTGANGLLIGGSGGGRVRLSAANAFTGQTTVANGTVAISSVTNAGAGDSSLGNPALAESAILLGSGTNAVGIDYTGSTASSSNRVLNLAGTTGTVTLSNSGTAPITWTSPLVFSGTGARTIQLGNNTDSVGGSVSGISDEGANKTSVTKGGLTNSIWTLTGNTYTGATKLDGGVLETSLASLAGSYINLDGDGTSNHAVLQTSGTLTRVQSTTSDPANLKLGSNSGFAAKGGDLTVTLNAGGQLTWASGSFMGVGTARLVFGSTTANGKVTFTNPINLNATDGFLRPIFVELGTGGDSAELSGILSPAATGTVGLSKLGNGTLILSGQNTFNGATTVTAGKLLINGNQSAATGATTVISSATLGGIGTIGGAITVNAGGTLAPGQTVGTLNAASSLTFGGDSTLGIEVNGATADRVNVTGALNIATAALNVSSSAPSAPVYIIATYGSIVGAFGTQTGVPAGYDVVIGYNSQNQIALVQTVSASAYQLWATSPPNNLVGADALPGSDPDHDGTKNILEFALAGDPKSGSSTGLSFPRMATVNSVPNVLTLTIATRTGAAFSADGNRMKSAAVDGMTYTVEASNTLGDWGGPVVTEVTGSDASTIHAALPVPVPPAGWTYKTFRTDDSSSSDAQDFIRAVVEGAG